MICFTIFLEVTDYQTQLPHRQRLRPCVTSKGGDEVRIKVIQQDSAPRLLV
jgi:hypothetical protein